MDKGGKGREGGASATRGASTYPVFQFGGTNLTQDDIITRLKTYQTS